MLFSCEIKLDDLWDLKLKTTNSASLLTVCACEGRSAAGRVAGAG